MDFRKLVVFSVALDHGLWYNGLIIIGRVLGIDPGYAIVGWGVVDYAGNRFAPVDFGAVCTDAGVPFERRLDEVYAGILEVIEQTQPEVLAIEKLFYQHNQTTVIGVAEARGVILLAAAQAGLPIYENAPMQVKQAVAGYGKAVKKQVQEMPRILLHLPAIPKPDDTADALAMAERSFRTLEAPAVYMDAEEHDLHAAYVSHISHITSFALALTVLEKEREERHIFDLAGGGFESTVRLAKSSAATWVPILLRNKYNVLDVLREHIHQLQIMRRMLERDDAEGLTSAFGKANSIQRIIH